jgi:hypothetical protein
MRQICNGWKADPLIARQVLAERTGRLAAALVGWDGVRILQDNCIWKPPGTKSLGMHQDGSYLDYLEPPEMITCWIALDDTSAEAGTITYAAPRAQEPRRVPCSAGLARAARARPPGRRRASPRPDRGQGGRSLVPPPQHLPRLRPQHRLGAPPRRHLAPHPGRDALSSGTRRPRLLALSQAWRPDDGRGVLPRRLEPRRGPLSVARGRARRRPRRCARQARARLLGRGALRRRETDCPRSEARPRATPPG